MKRLLIFQLVLLLLTALPFAVTAQQEYFAVEGSTIAVKGTSTLHDWKMISDSVVSTAQFPGDNKESQTQLFFSVKVKTLKSRMNKINNNAYEALKADEYPRIQFRAVSARQVKDDDGVERVLLTGDLTIAGVTKRKTVMLNRKVQENGKIICLGDIDVFMSEFGLEPPTGMGGLIKAKDEITISYKMNYEQTAQ